MFTLVFVAFRYGFSFLAWRFENIKIPDALGLSLGVCIRNRVTGIQFDMKFIGVILAMTIFVFHVAMLREVRARRS